MNIFDLYSKQLHVYGYIRWDCNSNMESSSSNSNKWAPAVYRKTITLTWDYGAIIRHLHHFLSNRIYKKPQKNGWKTAYSTWDVYIYARKPPVIWNFCVWNEIKQRNDKTTLTTLCFLFGLLSWKLHLMTWYTRLN